jgi:glycosyltransferase involved in cell wall biosynthesis
MASWPFGLMARLRRRSIHIVLSAHGTDVSYGRRGGVRGRLYRAYLAAGAKVLASAQVIANSQATADACRDAGFRRIEIVPLASDLRAPPVQPDASSNLLFAGRLVRRKGLSWFVGNVLPLLPDSISLDVAGTLWNDEEAASLSNPRVRYLGVLEEQALATAFAGALSVIVPNIEMANGEFEGFGLVAVEAAAAGGVVVAADIEGLRSAVRHGVTGFLMKPGDAAAWAARIIEISNWSRSDRDAFITESVTEVRTHFSWHRVATETEAVYDRLTSTML